MSEPKLRTYLFKLVIEVEAENEEKATEIALQSYKDGLGEPPATTSTSATTALSGTSTLVTSSKESKHYEIKP